MKRFVSLFGLISLGLIFENLSLSALIIRQD